MGDNLRLRYGDLHFDLKGARLKIGRVAAGNDIQVDDTMVSSKHLTIHNGKLTDTKSTNGTWINNVKIAKETKIALKAGDVIMLGKQGNPNTTLFVVENVVPPIVQEADDTSPPLPVGELKSKQPELTVLNAGRLEAVPMSSTTDSLPPPVPHSPMVEANSNAAEPLTQPYAPVAKRELKNRDDDHDFDIKLSGPSADINLLTLNLTTDNIVVNNDANNNDNPTPALNIDVPPSPHMHAPSLLSPSALKSPSLLLSPTADTVSPSIAPTHKTSSLSDPVVNGFDPTAVWSDLAIYEKREEAGPFAPDSQVVGCPQRSPDSEPRSTDPAGCASSSSSSRSTRSTELEDLDGSVATEPGQFSSVSSASVSVSGLPPSHSPANHAPAGLLAAAPDYLVDDTTGDAALDLTHPGDEPSDVIHFALDADPDPAPAPAPGLVLRARESPTLRHIPTSSKEPTSEPIEGGGVGGTSRGHGVVGGAGLLRERDSLVTAGVEVGYTGKKKKLLKKGGLEKGGAPDSNWQDWKYKYDEVEQRCSDLEFLLRYGSTKEEKREAQENDLLRAETQSLKRELEKRDKIVEGLQLQFDSERAKCAQLSQELAVARLLIAQLHAATNSSNNAALASPTTTARPRDDEGGQASANAFAATAIVPPLAKVRHLNFLVQKMLQSCRT
jgi:hypothetical protein